MNKKLVLTLIVPAFGALSAVAEPPIFASIAGNAQHVRLRLRQQASAVWEFISTTASTLRRPRTMECFCLPTISRLTHRSPQSHSPVGSVAG